jgi:hypothetical protein
VKYMTRKYKCDKCGKTFGLGHGGGIYRIRIDAIGFVPSNLKFIEAHLCGECYKAFQKKNTDITFEKIYDINE